MFYKSWRFRFYCLVLCGTSVISVSSGVSTSSLNVKDSCKLRVPRKCVLKININDRWFKFSYVGRIKLQLCRLDPAFRWAHVPTNCTHMQVTTSTLTVLSSVVPPRHSKICGHAPPYNAYGTVQVLHHEMVRETATKPLSIPMRWSSMSDNWHKDLPSEGMKAKVNRKCLVSFFAWTVEIPSIVKILFILFFVWDRSRSRSRSQSGARSWNPSRSRNSPTKTPQPWFDVAIFKQRTPPKPACGSRGGGGKETIPPKVPRLSFASAPKGQTKVAPGVW